jgi:hypothetical protein
MPRATYGPQVKARAQRLFEAILSFASDEVEGCEHLGLDLRWQERDSNQPRLVIQTTLRALEVLTQKDKYDGKFTKVQLRESLSRMADFLNILQDHRVHDRGSENWHFTLKLWARDTKMNLEQFEQAWEQKRPQKSKQ